MRRFIAGCVLASCLTWATPVLADDSRRIFDFTPLSTANPVVATIGGTVRIPISELRGFRDAEKLQAITDPDSLAQKRAVLNALVDEYLYVDEAYRTGVPETAAFVRQMEATRTMILTEFMAMRAAPAVTTALGEDAAHAMAKRLFDEATIVVSNEAYALLKHAAVAIDRASLAGPTSNAADRLQAIVGMTPEAALVSYEERTITVHQILVIYAGLPPDKRPHISEQAGLIAMIKPLILPELMALEAVKRGIAAEPAFRQKVIQNRNALLRFHTHGAIESRANEILRGPELEKHLQTFHREHGARYAAPFAVVRERVFGDFAVDLRDRLLAEKARELRKVRCVEVDEAVLRQL